MPLLDKLEKKIGFLAIPNLTVYLIAGQTIFYFMYMSGKAERGFSSLSAMSLLQGEWWRLATFLFDPPTTNIFFAFFVWYLFYLMGSALEGHWGTFRYNLFLLTGYLLTVAASFAIPYSTVTTTFLGGSVFLAFAFLFPDFELMLFFVLPVRIKWLALLTWLGYGYQLLFGSGDTRLMVVASIGNFLIFFSRDIIMELKYGKKRVVRKAAAFVAPPVEKKRHRCTICGITDTSHPHEDFRYCPQCEVQSCYCQEHIFRHDHIKKNP